jgi:hypothetical protein
MVGAVVLAVASVFASKADRKSYIGIYTATTSGNTLLLKLINGGLLHPNPCNCRTVFLQISNAALNTVIGTYPLYTAVSGTERLNILTP